MAYEPLLERMPTTRPAAFRDDENLFGLERPKYGAEADFKIHGGCGLMGICDESGTLMSGVEAIKAMAVQRDRGNGLGGGFAGYGIYPEFPDHYCFHMMYSDVKGKEDAEAIFDRYFVVDLAEPMPTRAVKGISDAPILWRYFLKPDPHKLEATEMTPDDFIVHTVMLINSTVDGAFVASSGKNMGAFKGVGFPEEIGHYYLLEEYAGHTWTGHNRFPTNTPGWWGGAHPFTLLDWSIVHNGEISSYGINSRYLEAFGYKCTLGTDTEVAAYLFDLLLRRHKLPLELAC
jgi:glutamate synthase domain-containing protein 1